MIRHFRWLAMLFAIWMVVVSPARAHAEVIDYDPATAPPELLTPDELARYDALFGAGAIPSILSTASPNGQYMLVVVSGRPTVLDLDARTLTPIPPEAWNTQTLARATTLAWISNTEAVFVTLDRTASPASFGKTVLNFPAGTLATTPFPLPQIEGMRVSVYGGQLYHTPDGAWHVPAYAVPTGAELLVAEPPARYESQTTQARVERVRLGIEPAADLITQTAARVLAINIDTGAATTITTVGPGGNLGGVLGTLEQRPGTLAFAYLESVSLSCYGDVIRNRQCRGGGNTTGTFLVREALGLVKPAENDLLLRTRLHVLDLASGSDAVIENSAHADGWFSDVQWTADGTLLLVTVARPSVPRGRPYPTYSNPNDASVKVFDPSARFVRDWDAPQIVRGGSLEALDGTRIMVMAPSNMDRHVSILDAGAPETASVPLFAGHGALYSWELAADLFVYVRGDVTLPGELYVAEKSDVAGTSEALTSLNESLGSLSRIAYQPIAYRTSSGYDVEGIYVYPSDWPFPPPEPKPVVVWQAGGPGGQMANTWGTSVESPYSLLPNFGIPVFMVNGAGRLSNGPQFYSDMAEGKNYGQRDIRDVKEGVDHLVAQGIADPSRVGVTGCSYGGYFTLQSLVEYPDVYKAGNTQCSLNDLLHEYNFGWAFTIAYLMGRSPLADPAEYVKDSPLYRAHQVRAPLLVFHGTDDFLPHEHMVNFHDQVASAGIATQMLRAFGEGHGFSYPNSQKYAFQLQLQWFRRHLGLTADDVFAPVWADQPVLPRSPRALEVTQ